MAEVIGVRSTLSDSNFKTRPNFKTVLRTDSNAGPNHLRQIEMRRLARHMKFPTLGGRGDVDSFQTNAAVNPAFKKWNDEGDFRPPAPYRDNVTLTDPVSGFVAVGADVDRNTGRRRIKTMVQHLPFPQTSLPPQAQTLVRNVPHAPFELQRAKTFAGAPSNWDSKKLSDGEIRANLGGWTSDKDPRKASEEDVRGAKPAGMPETEAEKEQALREQRRHDYIWKTSTARQYAEVPWDKVLPNKMYPCDTTLEPKPDMVSQRWTLKRYAPRAEEWQAVGRAWDWFQTRKSHIDYRPADFCEHLPRAYQIPGYSGEIGGENLDEKDNRQEAFAPFTVKRNVQPWYSDTAARPNIPHYNGCTLYRSQTEFIPARSTDPSDKTSAEVYRSLPVGPNQSEHKRESHMSKMITTVPPHNPFNKVKKPDPIAM